MRCCPSAVLSLTFFPSLEWNPRNSPELICFPLDSEQSDTTEQLHFHFSLSCIGEGNGNHSSVLAWRIPGKGEPGGLPSMESHRVGHDWSDLAAVAAAADSENSLFILSYKSSLNLITLVNFLEICIYISRKYLLELIPQKMSFSS